MDNKKSLYADTSARFFAIKVIAQFLHAHYQKDRTIS